MSTQDITALGYNHLEPGQPGNTKAYRVCGAVKSDGDLCQVAAGYGTSHAGMGRCKRHGGASLAGPDNAAFKNGRYSKLFRGRLAQHYKQIAEADENPLDLIPELQVQRTMLALAIDRLQTVGIAEDNSNYLKHTEPVHNEMTNDPPSSSSSINQQLTSQESMGGVGGDTSLAYSESSSRLDPRAPGSDVEPWEIFRDMGDTVVKFEEMRASGSELVEMIEEEGREEDKRGVYVRKDGSVVDTRNYKPRKGNKRREVGEQVRGLMERAERKIEGGGDKLWVGVEDLELVLEYSNAIVATVGKMEAIRNQSALTKAEVVYLMVMMKETIIEFIPDAGERKKFIEALRKRVPIFGGEEDGT